MPRVMRIVIVGGGIVRLTPARFLRLRGIDPVVLERMPAGHLVPRGRWPSTTRCATPAGTSRNASRAAGLVVACGGIMSPVRGMADLESRITRVEDAYVDFISPSAFSRSIHMTYLSGGDQVGIPDRPQGSAGGHGIARIDEEAAKAPGLEAFERSWARLMPEAEPALGGLTSMDQVRYWEPRVLRVPEWWGPGVVLIGDASRFFGPETGVGAGLGLGDAHNPGDPDAACRACCMWRSR